VAVCLSVCLCIQEKIKKLQLNEAMLDDERNQLRQSVDDAENQLMTSELLRRSLEGDCERLRLALSEKEAENEALSCRVDELTRQVDDIESKNHSLTTTINRLNLSLTHTEQQESVHKHQVIHFSSLSLSLSLSLCVLVASCSSV